MGRYEGRHGITGGSGVAGPLLDMEIGTKAIASGPLTGRTQQK